MAPSTETMIVASGRGSSMRIAGPDRLSINPMAKKPKAMVSAKTEMQIAKDLATAIPRIDTIGRRHFSYLHR
jgi:hypothetical protein